MIWVSLFHTELRTNRGQRGGWGGHCALEVGGGLEIRYRLDDSHWGMSLNLCWALHTGIRARLPGDFPKEDARVQAVAKKH